MATSFSPFKRNTTQLKDSLKRGKSVKGAADKSKTGLALSEPLLATLYAQGTPTILLRCIKNIPHF